MALNELKQSFDTNNGNCAIADIVDYLDTCCFENRDINGDTVQLFPTLIDLIDCYCDELPLTNENKRLIAYHCVFNANIMSLVRTNEIFFFTK